MSGSQRCKDSGKLVHLNSLPIDECGEGACKVCGGAASTREG